MRTRSARLLAMSLFAVAGPGLGTGSSNAATRPRLESPTLASLAEPAATFASTTLDARGLRLIRSINWHGGRYKTGSGESVNVAISPAYASDPGAAARWADFFASLVHGPELALLNAYIAPLVEVQAICGGDDVLGCYRANHLVSVGDSSGGVPPASVAAHEYGHHVAFNRVNPPWIAENWGTKRWATAMNICARVQSGTAFPGDEGADYTLNPGEAFAESFRVLNETLGGLPITWPIVDHSFLPDPTALQALRADIVDPWTAPTTKTIRVAFARGRRTWTRPIAIPLDGVLDAQLSTGANDLQLLAPDGRTVLSQGSWTTTGGKALQYQICGGRSFVLRVTRHAAARRFTLQLSSP